MDDRGPPAPPDRDILTDQRWQRVEELFLAAADLDPERRPQFLATEAGDDAALRGEVEALLRASGTAGDRVAGAVGLAARQFADQAALSRVGERVGRYRLVELLGHGGMGTVYLAERTDDPSRSQVAIKFVRGMLAAPDLGRRLQSERQILASLDHPGIEQLLDADTTEDGTPYLVLEYLKGEPLDQWCDRRDLGVRARIEMVCRIGEALTYAHDRRVVHRDLKPSNIVVTADGTPKLLDFGIAKLLEAEPGRDATTTFPALTPAYASPEQIRGERVTATSDVYSLGVVLFRLLTGRTPFDLSGASAAEIERRISQERPLPPSDAVTGRDSAWRTALRGELDAVILRALAKRPEQRQPSVAVLVEQLNRWLATPPGGHPIRALGYLIQRATRTRAGQVAIVAVAGLAGLAAWRASVWWSGRVTLEFLPAQVLASALPAPARALTGDFNGDGRGDLVWFRPAASPSAVIALGQADGTLVVQPPLDHPDLPTEGWAPGTTLLAGDFDGDGRDDLLWSWYSERELPGHALWVSLWLSGPGAPGRFLPPQRLPPQGWSTAWQPQVGDLSGDGADELVLNLLGQDNLVRAFGLQDRSEFAQQFYLVHVAKVWAGYQTMLGDVDADGRTDLIWNDVPNWGNRTYVGRSRGNELDILGSQDHPDSTGWEPFLLRAGDVNGDRRTDLVWLDPRADPVPVHVALGEATGQFRFLPAGSFPRPALQGQVTVELGDLNGDGRAGLLWEGDGPGDGIWYAAATPRGGFKPARRVGGVASAGGDGSARAEWAGPGVAVDVNGDGRLDLVWVTPDGQRLQVAVARSPGLWSSARER